MSQRFPTPPVPPSGEQIEIRHGNQRAVIVEVGGSLRELTVGDWSVVDGYAESEMCSAGRGQPLIPWPNRIEDGSYEFDGARYQLALTEPSRHTAIHGLVRWSNWTVAEREDARVVMVLRLYPQTGYPFALDLSIVYALSGDGLRVTTSARNVGRQRCPYAAGVHPYVTTGLAAVDDAVLQLPARRYLPADERGLPTGNEPVDGTGYDFRHPRPVGNMVLDTAYTDLIRDADGMASVVLASPTQQRSVAVWMDSAYAYVMAFTGDTLGDRARRSLGVEPMTCAPNAFRSGAGLIVVDPGGETTSNWGITATSAAEPGETAA